MSPRAPRWLDLRRNVRADVDDELAFHVEMRIRDLEARGLSPATARAEALREFGDLKSIRSECVVIDERRFRRSNRREVILDMFNDLRFAARALRKSPGYAMMAITCVALGVAVTTSIFTAVHGILLRSLPYPDAGRLVAIYGWIRDEHGVNISYPDYLTWRGEAKSFSQLGMWTWLSVSLSGDAQAERVNGARVTANLFPLLGVAPLLGRGFTPDEELPGNGEVVLLSRRLWERRYGADSSIVGRTILVNSVPHTVLGVMPDRYNFPDQGDLWLPLVPNETMRARGNRYLAGAIGRLAPGATHEAAVAEIELINQRLQKAYPENFGWRSDVMPLRDDLVGDLRRPLLIFLGAVGMVLLIACANVANLMLVRGSSRQREMGVRVALGAARARVVRHVLAESLLIAALGGALGAYLARFGVRLIELAFPNDVPFYISLDVDVVVLGFVVLLSAASGVAFGILPALRATRFDVSRSLREGGRGEAGGGRRVSALRSGLVVGELALSLILLIGATLLVRSYRAYLSTDLGFATRGVLSARVGLPSARYSERERRQAFWEAAFEKLRALPGVESVASAQGTPFSGWNVQAQFSVEGKPAKERGGELVVHYQNVTPDWFETIDVPLRRGRGFTSADRDSAQHIGIINETLARREFANEDPLGKRIKFGGVDSTEPWITIIGVVADYRHYRLPQPMGPAIYFPELANPSYQVDIVLATTHADPHRIEPAMRRVLGEIDPDVPAYRIRSFDEIVATSLWSQRLQGQVLGVFAVLAVLLAAVGTYGVISYAVAQRSRELGVRMALGATRRQVAAQVVGQGARLALAGVALGLVGALARTRVPARVLFEVPATDLPTFVLMPIVLVIIALVASFVPARRATRLDPVVAIRSE